MMNGLKKRLLVAGIATCLGITGVGAVTGFAATEHWNDNSAKTAISSDWEEWKTEWETVKTDYEQIALTPGSDETQMNFAWYSKTPGQAKVRISTSADMTNTTEDAETLSNVYAESLTNFTGTATEYREIDGVTYYSNKVTATNLQADTTYYYQYYLDGQWTSVEYFTTGNPDEFTVLYVGDPQIGASSGQVASESGDAQTAELAARNDAYSWNTTLTAALNSHPDIDFIISAGDQINSTSDEDAQEIEYAGLLSADAMANLPIAPTIGNHDAQSANYQNHFNVPNAYTDEENATAAGNDYYYTYGSALFIVLNTNNYNCADHEALIKEAVEANPDATWRIVTFHQDIYGSGADHSDSDGIILRTQLTTILDKYDIDVVLQGHDHTYSRSFLLTSDGEDHTAYDSSASNLYSTVEGNEEYQLQNLCYRIADTTQGTVNNPEGILYMEANSATGSKYYNLIATQQDYIAERNQTWTPTYSIIDITPTSFTINTYDVNTNEAIDDSFTITKIDDASSVSIGDEVTVDGLDYEVTAVGENAKVACVGGADASGSVTIPASITIDGTKYKVAKISAGAFRGNKQITSVTVGKNVTTIGKAAFKGCSNLKTVKLKSKIKTIKANAFSGISSSAKIKVPSDKLTKYTKLLNESGFTGKIKSL